jgi:hypothetical protein
MSASVASRAWTWRSFLWAGVVGSLVAWAWVWFRVGGASAVVLLFAVAAVVLAYRGAAGMRTAMAGVMVAGFAMFLASLYWTYTLMLQGSPTVNALDVLTIGVVPMVFAIVLLVGAGTGFRHVAPSEATPTATTARQA